MLKYLLIVLFSSLISFSLPVWSTTAIYACDNNITIEGEADGMGGFSTTADFTLKGREVKVVITWDGSLHQCDHNGLVSHVYNYLKKNPATPEQQLNVAAGQFILDNFPDDSTASVRVYAY